MFMKKERLFNLVKNGNKKKDIRAIVCPFRALSVIYFHGYIIKDYS